MGEPAADTHLLHTLSECVDWSGTGFRGQRFLGEKCGSGQVAIELSMVTDFREMRSWLLTLKSDHAALRGQTAVDMPRDATLDMSTVTVK